jgi:hypothetical protein
MGAFGVSFLLGLLGWLAVSIVNVDGPSLWFWAGILGFASGLITKRWTSLFALLAGILAAYPVALAAGVFQFLGEGYVLLLTTYLVAGAGGHTAGMIAVRRMKPSTDSQG